MSVVLLVTASGCGGADDEVSPETTTPNNRPGACVVTLPGDEDANGTTFGTQALRVALPGKYGVIPVIGGYAEEVAGGIRVKVGWWRGIEGQLSVSGRRVDAEAPELSVDVPDGYGDSGLQPTGLTFPTEGCWEITGSIADELVTFRVLVVRP